MNDIKISLVFACYNVASYLEQLYKLLITQPYKNIEVIFVEDCSTDNTKDILKGFTDPRVRLIENPINMGAAISRNVGIKYSTGDYIWFPDPDDLFDERIVEEIVDIINDVDPDVIVTGMREDYEIDHVHKYSKIILCRTRSGLISKEEFNEALLELEEVQLFGNMANKIYKRSIINKYNVVCANLALKEDFDFNIKFFSIVNNFYILNKPYYFYKKRNNSSLTTKFVPDYWHIHKNSVVMFKGLLELNGELSLSAKKLLVNRFYRFFLSAIERNTNSQANLNFIEQRKWVKSTLISDTTAKWFIQNSNLINGKLKFFSILVNYKCYTMITMLGHIIKYIKRYLPILFTKIK